MRKRTYYGQVYLLSSATLTYEAFGSFISLVVAFLVKFLIFPSDDYYFQQSTVSSGTMTNIQSIDLFCQATIQIKGILQHESIAKNSCIFYFIHVFKQSQGRVANRTPVWGTVPHLNSLYHKKNCTLGVPFLYLIWTVFSLHNFKIIFQCNQ